MKNNKTRSNYSNTNNITNLKKHNDTQRAQRSKAIRDTHTARVLQLRKEIDSMQLPWKPVMTRRERETYLAEVQNKIRVALPAGA